MVLTVEQQIFNFVAKNWPVILWTASTLASIVGLILYNAKVVLPGFLKRMETMEKDIQELKDKSQEHDSFVKEGDCKDRHEKFDKDNKAEHKVITESVDKVLKCVQAGEKRRQEAKIIQYSFMAAVKEKLKLEFDVPSVKDA